MRERFIGYPNTSNFVNMIFSDASRIFRCLDNAMKHYLSRLIHYVELIKIITHNTFRNSTYSKATRFCFTMQLGLTLTLTHSFLWHGMVD